MLILHQGTGHACCRAQYLLVRTAMDRTDALAGLVDVERLMTDTLCLTRDFNKRHKNVLRAYDMLQCSAEFSRLNFEPSDYGYTNLMNKYDITLKPNRIKRRPVPMDFSGPEGRRALLAIARRVIATHADVLKALANR